MDDSDNRARSWFLDALTRDQVRGYLQRTQAHALAALLDQQSRIGLTGSLAEIGVYFGKTLIGLARASRSGEKVLGVDPLKIGSQDLAPELTRNLKTYLTEDEVKRVVIRRALSTDLGPLEWMRGLGQAARFIHLDGHHARETMLHDLQLAGSWLQKGAVVVIDDFLNELHPDLSSGILDGLMAHPQLEPVAVVPRMGHIDEGGSKLVCATRGDGAMYREALDRALADHLRPWNDRMLGGEVRVYRSLGPSQPAARTAAEAKPLPVVFALHDAKGSYWLNTAVALSSVAQHAKHPIHIYVLHDDSLSAVAKQRLTEIANALRTPLTLMPVRPPPSLPVRFSRQYSPACVFRLMIPKLFPDAEAVVYLDSDLVSNGVDVTELAAAAPADAPLSAVIDVNIAIPQRHREVLQELGLDPASYFNSGVLVMRPALIQEDLVQACLAFSEAFPSAIHADQDFLNHHFAGRFARLDPRFNHHIGQFDQAVVAPLSALGGKILHYAGKVKPLDGKIGPGLIPFLAHASLVPEIIQGGMYEVSGYFLPSKDDAHGLIIQSLRPKPDKG
ncbi:MAG TPA: glycosyltransferase [Phenylobacterium sp.]|nr:glycosyltransferase [Phenylobacterium sp.]